MKPKKFISKHIYKIIPVFALIALALIYFLINRLETKKNTFTTEKNQFYFYISDYKAEYAGKLKIDKTKKKTELSFDDAKVNFDSTPIYYQKKPKTILPKVMLVVYPSDNGKVFRSDYFGIIEDKNGFLVFNDYDVKKDLKNCFLYDTNDLYFFIDETIITFDDKEIILSPMSYATVIYNDRLEVYDYAADKFTTYDMTDTIVYAQGNDYKINLSMDSYEYSDQDHLLIKNIDILKRLK